MPLRVNSSQLDPKILLKLLKKLSAGVSVRDQNQNYINPEALFYLPDELVFLDGDDPFTDRSLQLIINPEELVSGKKINKDGFVRQSITIPDVFTILQSIYNKLYENDYISKYKIEATPKQQEKFLEILILVRDELASKVEEVFNQSGQIQIRLKILSELIELLTNAVKALIEPEEKEDQKKKIIRSEVIPAWLEEARKKPLLEENHWKLEKKRWKLVAEVISAEEDMTGYFDLEAGKYLNKDLNKEDREKFPGIKLRKDDELPISIVVLRDFLNDWATKIIKEDKENKESPRIFAEDVEKELARFPSSENSVAQTNEEYVQQLDIVAIRSFKKHLLIKLKEYKEPKVVVSGATESASTNDSGGGSEDQVEIKPKTPEEIAELVKLKDDILEQQSNTQREALRLETISTNFVLAASGIKLSAALQSDPAFKILQKQINNEVAELLIRDPHALDNENGRAKFVHSFLFRLMANPKFQVVLEITRERYAEIEIEKEFGTHPDNPKLVRELVEKLKKDPNADIDALIKKIDSDLNAARSSIPLTSENKVNIKDVDSSSFSDLLETYGFTPDQQRNILEGADLFLLVRSNPDKIASFNDELFKKVFDVEISGLSSAQKRELTSLLSAYIGVKRRSFESEFRSLSVGQIQDFSSDQFSTNEISELLRKKELYRKSGLSIRHFVQASTLTKSQIRDVEKNQAPGWEEIKKASDIQLQERAQLYARLAQEKAVENPVVAEALKKQNISFRSGELTDTQQRALNTALIQFFEGIVDLSNYEFESGVVTNELSIPVRTEETVAQMYSSEEKTGFKNTIGSSAISEGAVLASKLGTNALLPGLGFLIPDEAHEKISKAAVQVTGVAAAGLFALMAYIAALFKSVLLGAIGGAIAGGVAGASIGFGLGGPIGAFVGGAVGSVAGAVGGGGLTAFFSNSGVGVGAKTFGKITASESLATNLGARAQGLFSTSAGSSLAGVGVTGVVTTAVIGTFIAYSQTIISFLPPSEILSAGAENKYMTLSKLATPSQAEAPQAVNYSIDIAAKPGYVVQITDISDTITIKSKDKEKKLTKSSDQDFSKYKVALDPEASGTAHIEYSLEFGAEFQDSLISNAVKVSFTTTDESGTAITDSLTDRAYVCFGDCPKIARGCWPASGTIVEGPYESPSSTHNHASKGNPALWIFLDAIDIANVTNDDVPIYTPFDGTASFYTYSQTNGEGGGGNYGNRVSVKTTDGSVLLFAHLDRFSDQFQPGQTYDVSAGDQLGLMGTTGDSGPGAYGKHLHYEFRPAKTGTEGSPPDVSNIVKLIPESEPLETRATWQVTGLQQVVSTCSLGSN